MNNELFLITNVKLEGTIVGRELPVVAQVPNQHVAPTLLRPPFEPVDVIAVHGWVSKPQPLRGNRGGRDRRRPRAEGSDLHSIHRPHPFSIVPSTMAVTASG